MTLSDSRLPALIVLLSDTLRTLREECPDPGMSAVQATLCLEAEVAALMESLREAEKSVSREALVSLCRRAPSPRILEALLAQQEVLSYLADQTAYWSEDGDGYWAIELGKAALRETWWPYHDQIWTWYQTNHCALTDALSESRAALVAEAARQEVKGVIEPLVERLDAYLALMRG